MTTFVATRTAPTADSSVTLKAVRPARTIKAGGKVKRFLNTLMRSLASAHA
jgi:hypothetical protein